MAKPALILAAALLALPAAPAQARTAAPQGAAPAGQLPTPSPDVRLDGAFLIGFWTDNDDCREVIEFIADGRFIAANGGTGLWTLEGDRLTLSGRATATLRLIPTDRDTITVVNANGSLGRSTRCARRKGRTPDRAAR